MREDLSLLFRHATAVFGGRGALLTGPTGESL